MTAELEEEPPELARNRWGAELCGQCTSMGEDDCTLDCLHPDEAARIQAARLELEEERHADPA